LHFGGFFEKILFDFEFGCGSDLAAEIGTGGEGRSLDPVIWRGIWQE